jgi:integrative and conjugative element protein (TIGR02256 family)
MPRIKIVTATQILIPRRLLEQMEVSGRASEIRNESGGLLLGFRKGLSIEIKEITFPQPRDRASPTLFRRSAFGHREKALASWKASGGTVDWVGEWHTHPNGFASPSFIDRLSWRKLAKHSKRPMAFIIIGATSAYVGWQESAHRSARTLGLVEADSDNLLYS